MTTVSGGYAQLTKRDSGYVGDRPESAHLSE